MRVFAGGIATETNTFAPIPTGLKDYIVARSIEELGSIAYGSALGVFHKLTIQRGWDFTFGLYAFARPAGLTTRQAYETLRDEFLARLTQALPVDIVLLGIHGAMVADEYDDCEMDLVQRIRQIVGPDAKIGVELDLHCDISPQMVADADAIITYKEYPHIDVDNRAADLFNLIADAALGRTQPTMAVYDCRMLGMYLTPFEPMRSYVDHMLAMEGQDGVLSVSLLHGFPYADVPTTGSYALAITDNNPGQAARVAAELGRRLFDMRHEVAHQPAGLGEALDQALALTGQGKPVVFADTGDNAGGGAPSDSTFVLRELLKRGVTDVGIAMFWDPIVVQLAQSAGVGARLPVRLGGKIGPVSGDPLDLTVEVKGLLTDMKQTWPQQTEAHIRPCGDAAWLSCQGIDIIVNTLRSQVLGTDVFTNFGIDLNAKKLLVVKSTQHFYAAYAPIAGAVIYGATPGTLPRDLTTIPYQRLDTRKYPWVDDPFAPLPS